MAEKWLIDANSICRGCPSYADCKGECWSEGECEIYDVLVKAPTVDAVEVVRCKDCKYFGTAMCAIDAYAFEVTEKSFCSYGERRNDG